MTDYQVVDKKVSLKMVGLDGNAWSLMGAFQSQAKREGWAPGEIKLVLDKCQESGYQELLCTLAAHCEKPFGEDEDEEYEEDEEEEYEDEDDEDEDN